MQFSFQAHVELVIINTCLCASVYCALVLTIERYILIGHPHSGRTLDPQLMARLKIILALVLALILHLPMSFQYSAYESDEQPGIYYMSNNRAMLCHKSWTIVFSWSANTFLSGKI